MSHVSLPQEQEAPKESMLKKLQAGIKAMLEKAIREN